jgi:hypothetical protein
MIRQATKLSKKPGPVHWCYGDDYFDKPPRVRQKAWQRFCEAVEHWEERLWNDFAATVLRRVGRHPF